MEKRQEQHKAAMARTAFEAAQKEASEAAELEAALTAARQEGELKHLAAMQRTVGLQPSEVSQILIAREQGPPTRLIQISGDARPIVQVGDAGVVDAADDGASSARGRLAVRRAPSPKPSLFSR